MQGQIKETFSNENENRISKSATHLLRLFCEEDFIGQLVSKL